MPPSKPGPLALVGSGEYTPAMRETDLLLLNALGGAEAARVVVLPTAAGLEHPSSPQRWADMGVRHFSALGAQVAPAMLLTRADAGDPQILSLLEQADFYYFSGGNPQHLVESLHDTPAWEIISRRHMQGAALAGCSAGAMAFGGWTPSWQSLSSGRTISFVAALGLLPRLIVLPHFDTMARYIPDGGFNRMIAGAPPGATVLGIDEDTALVRLADGVDWQVSGRQTVSLLDQAAAEGKTVYRAGANVPLAAGA